MSITPHIGRYRDDLVAALRRRLADTRPIPLTGTQQGIWLAERLDPGRSGYHDTAVIRVEGPLDANALAAAFTAAQACHEALRCRLTEVDGEPHQVFDVTRNEWNHDDLRGRPGDPAVVAARLVGLDATEPFDLAAGPLWRVRLIRTDEAEHLLVIVVHHLIGDGWSHGILLDSVLRGYHGAAPPPDRVTHYADWLRARCASEARSTGRTHTVARRLAPHIGRRELPGLDGPRTGSRRAAALPVQVSPDLLIAFARACARVHTTLFMGLAGLFGLVVARLSGVGPVVASMPVADRNDDAARAVLGCLINNVPVLLDVTSDLAAGEAISVGRDGVLTALGTVDVPYRDVVRALQVPAGHDDPLTNLGVEEFNAPSGMREVGALRLTPLPRAHLRLRHDLTLSVDTGGNRVELLYAVDRWAAEAVAMIATELAAVIAEVAD